MLLTGDFPNQMMIEQQLNERFDLPIKKLTLPNDMPSEFGVLYGLGLRGERFD